MLRLALCSAAVAAVATGPTALGSDQSVRVVAGADYRTVERAAASASRADPESVQGAYDAARDMQERLRQAGPASASCTPLLRALAQYASARILEQEGIDRPDPASTTLGAARAGRARARIAASAPSCRGDGGGTAPARLAMSPAGSEAFYGAVVAAAPSGATSALLRVDGRDAARAGVRRGRARFRVAASPGPHDLAVVFSAGGRPIAGSSARAAILLPSSARTASPGSRSDPGRSAAIARALGSSPPYRAAVIQDLTTGSVAGVNQAARFPAASTVKLGLLVDCLVRLGATPERSRFAYDLKAMTTWSSNLATNRLLGAFGVAAATDGLRRLGASASTFPGEYIVGTELQPGFPAAGGGSSPPAVSARVTTAEDLARMLFAIHASAVGVPAARRETGLTVHQARLALGWLLASQQRGDNVSLLAGGAAGDPIAQKNGWLRAARHAAGIVYTRGGPRIVVLLTYDAGGVGLAEGRSLGRRLAALAR